LEKYRKQAVKSDEIPEWHKAHLDYRIKRAIDNRASMLDFDLMMKEVENERL